MGRGWMEMVKTVLRWGRFWSAGFLALLAFLDGLEDGDLLAGQSVNLRVELVDGALVGGDVAGVGGARGEQGGEQPDQRPGGQPRAEGDGDVGRLAHVRR